MNKTFILAGNTKEKIVTAGALIACCLLVALSARLVYIDMTSRGLNICDLILSLSTSLIAVAIFKGAKFGYFMARLISGGGAFSAVVGALSGFAYDDLLAAHASWTNHVIWVMSFAALALVLFYCLGEHAKLRGVYPPK
jgi:hypothetical protein